MAKKSRTFVRALRRATRKSKPAQVSSGHTGDIEMLVHAAPPEAIGSNPDAARTFVTEYEYDDMDPEMNEANAIAAEDGLFSHGGAGDGRPRWKRAIWEDLAVGDIIKITEDESIPADVLICATSEEESVAFVETKNLDGETNLKSRNAVPALTHMRTAAACADPTNSFEVDCDRPELQMYKLNAAVVVKGERFPVDLQTTLLRGTILRNTKWVIGVVMFTGLDTKLVLNSGGTPSKRSKVERQMNPMVFLNLIILAVMAVVCGIVDSVLEHRDYPRLAPWLFADNQSDDNPSINGLVTWAFALITFQNIVPISLYVSIEVVRTCQAVFIYFDKEIWYEKTNQATVARSWNLADDLGQIEYIFSDKTGTLTQVSVVHCLFSPWFRTQY